MLSLGYGAQVHSTAVVPTTITLELGDHSYIGPGVRIVGSGRVVLGDYCKIHDSCFINAYNFIIFGHNTWIGERCVIDGTGGIRAGNNVGAGIGSHLYSHIAHGDVLGGCTLKSEKELTIDHDAWFVGMCLVSPVHVGAKSVAYLGSTVTRDMLPNHVYAGVPAKDITDKVGVPWIERSADDKLDRFLKYKQDFKVISPSFVSDNVVPVFEFKSQMFDDGKTYFNLATREYTKKRSHDEITFMRWLVSWKARFVPNERDTL